MPWTISDVDSHIKGLSAHQKTVWAAVANSALAKCERTGGKDCEASAIKQANAMAQKAKESAVDEAGARHSAADMKHIQSVHDSSRSLGAVCDMGASDATGAAMSSMPYEFVASDRSVPVSEAANLRLADSHHLIRGTVQEALNATIAPSANWADPAPHIRELFADQVVYDHKGKTFTQGYSVVSEDGKPTCTLADNRSQVHTAYVPASEAEESRVYFVERNISQEERDSIPAEDFAGKNKSFPIVKPADVAAAAASIGRAGSDNYSPDELKRRIIAIAKRKGETFEEQLPKSWEDELDKTEKSENESAVAAQDANLTEVESDISEMLEHPFVQEAVSA